MPSSNNASALLAPLFELDRQCAQEAVSILAKSNAGEDAIVLVAEQAALALCQEINFGRAQALAMARLAANAPYNRLQCYARLMAWAARQGSSLGKALAKPLGLVLEDGSPQLRGALLGAAMAMNRHGVHTLTLPMEALCSLLSEKDFKSSLALCRTLGSLYSRPLTYVQALSFTQVLPAVIRCLEKEQRGHTLQRIAEAASIHPMLVSGFADGLERGLDALDEQGLADFTAQALKLFAKSQDAARRHLALESLAAAKDLHSLQKAVSLAGVASNLARYLCARTGLTLFVRPAGALSINNNDGQGKVLCAFDGASLFLPEKIGIYSTRAENEALYKALARLEAGLAEFSTPAFDLQKACDMADQQGIALAPPSAPVTGHDLDAFFGCFACQNLARDLFTLFEHGRTRVLGLWLYPKLTEQIAPFYELCLEREFFSANHPLAALYLAIAAGHAPNGLEKLSSQALDLFERAMSGPHQAAHKGPELCALLTAKVYKAWEKQLQPDLAAYSPLALPFGRGIFPQLFFRRSKPSIERARLLQARLAALGVKVYAAEIRQAMESRQGQISARDIKKIAANRPQGKEPAPALPQNRLWQEVQKALESDIAPQAGQEPELAEGEVFRYPEWSAPLGDYLQNACRVVARHAPKSGQEYYNQTLVRHRGLASRLKRIFELQKPQGLELLRRWVEGDAFDYRALLDYAVDRYAGRTPSERLYIKRIKKVRDISTLLLVDISRSTANAVNGSARTVLEVEKDAIVLFCQALEAVGDSFAVAAYSGAGPLRVDYFKVKDFDEGISQNVKERISGLAPARNTRMGAAIRHASSILAQRESRVRLLILLGDGFPNDTDYKGSFAIEDTRMAIREAKSKNIFVHAITVNLPAAAQLDRLFGEVRHTLISDITQLPLRLAGIYRSLTS
ncbi:MAG: VWA domain-containing protein [Desulfatibacillaceae bacterium]|nr:VWA domain-containing protein [Desulfatibacillaceae bacterium]